MLSIAYIGVCLYYAITLYSIQNIMLFHVNSWMITVSQFYFFFEKSFSINWKFSRALSSKMFSRKKCQPVFFTGHHFYAQPTGYSPGNPDYMHSHAYILSTESMGFQCPHCGCSVWSRTDYEFGVMTYLWSFLICLLFFPLFWVPFVCDYCKDVNHKCPQCNYQLAQLRRF